MTNNLTKLLLYNNSIEYHGDYILLNSINENVLKKKDILEDLENTFNYLSENLNLNLIKNIALLFHNDGSQIIPFGFNLTSENNYKYFGNNLINLLKLIRNKKGSSFILDILSCEFNTNDFKNEVKQVEENLDIIIRYSFDLTGNLGEESNWILESHNINVRKIYFTDNVLSWNGTLTSSTGTRVFSIDKNGVMKGWGSYRSQFETFMDALGTSAPFTGTGATRFLKVPTQITGNLKVKSYTTCDWLTGLIDENNLNYLSGLNGSALNMGYINTTTNKFTLHNSGSNLNNMIAISGGTAHMIALNSSGHVWGWGRNNDGQVGATFTSNSIVPIRLPYFQNNNITIKHISAGLTFSVFLDFNGNVYTTGLNTSKCLVLGGHETINSEDTTLKIFTPEMVPYFKNNNIFVQEIHTIGAFSILFLDDTGKLYSGGDDTQGQLGKGTFLEHSSIPIHILSDIVHVGGGLQHSIAIDKNSNIYSWGRNIEGQCANGDNLNLPTPTLINLPDELNNYDEVEFMYFNRNGSHLLDIYGNLYSIGKGIWGELGNNTTSNSLTWIKVPGLSDIVIPMTDEHKSNFMDLCFRTLNYKTNQDLDLYLNNLSGKITSLTRMRFEKYIKRNLNAFTNKISNINGSFIENQVDEKLESLDLTQQNIYYCLFNSNNNEIDLDSLNLQENDLIYLPGNINDTFVLNINNNSYNFEIILNGVRYNNEDYSLDENIILDDIVFKISTVGSIGLSLINKSYFFKNNLDGVYFLANGIDNYTAYYTYNQLTDSFIDSINNIELTFSENLLSGVVFKNIENEITLLIEISGLSPGLVGQVILYDPDFEILKFEYFSKDDVLIKSNLQDEFDEAVNEYFEKYGYYNGEPQNDEDFDEEIEIDVEEEKTVTLYTNPKDPLE